MKKFLLSIFALMLAVFSVQAQDATLSFADKAQRTSFSTAQQVWEQNGITFTNKKGSGNNIADYAKPVRLYQNSQIIVECSLGNITQIVFDCNSSSYATVLKNSIGTTATTSSDKVTVTLDGSSKSFTIAKLTAQVRMDALTVTYKTTGGGGTPDVPEVQAPDDPTLPASCNFDGSMIVTITSDATVYYTTDESNPATSATRVEYTKPFEITATTTVKAIAVNEGGPSGVVSATYTKNEPVDPNAKEVEATISFASTAQRQSQNSNSQVWSNGGIKFTNNKASSTTNVGNYSNPVRLYAKSNIVIEHAAMTKIVFACNSSSYATELKNSIGNSATVNKSDVTVTFASPVDIFEVESLTAQVRLNSLTVTYITTEKVVKTPIITPESCGFYAGENVKVVISAEEGTIYYTLDGNDPTTSSDAYSEPFIVSETTTVKAIAVVDGTASEVVTAVYKKGIDGTVADAFDAYVDGEKLLAIITGYIVGYVNGNNISDNGKECVFSVADSIKTNILIANKPYETDYTKCIAVQLPNNNIRTTLNLVDNPSNLNKKVILKGSLEKYLNIIGLKDVVVGELVEEESYTLSVSNAGWATLYLDFNAQIPTFEGEDAGAYIVTGVKEGNWLQLVKVEGVLPANTGILVKADAKDGGYTFNYAATATANVDGNLLKGTTKKELITKDANKEYYALGLVDNIVCFYNAVNGDNENEFYNNAFKAYLEVENVTGGVPSASLRFDFGGTTAIEEVETEAAETVIYDLTGRRVNEITKAGVYIVNGHKVLVK